MKEVAVGIDIGGTFTKYGIVDKEGNCLTDGAISSTDNEDIDDFLLQLKTVIDKSIDSLYQPIKMVGVGIGAPKGNFYKGTIEYASNLNWKNIVPIIELFQKHYDLPMFLTNDANAAAIGEMVYGGAKDMKNFIVITLGTGLGSGLVVNGELVYGHDGFAGEIGHVTIEPNGRMCATGRRGSLETYVSASGIKRTIFQLLADTLHESEFRNVTFNQLTAKMIFDATKKGDKIALEAFELTGKYLGEALSDTVLHTSPEAIFLFGGLANSGELIFEPTKRHLEKNLLQIFQDKVKILPSGLAETNAAVMGASALVWKELSN